MIIIPTWDQYLGKSLTTVNIKSPYQSPADVDSDYEASGFGGDKVGAFSQMQVGSGNSSAFLSGIDETWRQWIGAVIPTDAPYRVDKNGVLYAAGAVLSGYSKINVFKQDSIPTSLAVGDIWFDTDDGSKIYRAASIGADQITSGEWEAVDDSLKKSVTSQVLSGDYNLGSPVSGSVKIDGANNRIVINDGTNSRIVIGNV